MTETIEPTRLPLIGDPAPAFEVESTHGVISLDDYKGKWIMLFSHPTAPMARHSAVFLQHLRFRPGGSR